MEATEKAAMETLKENMINRPTRVREMRDKEERKSKVLARLLLVCNRMNEGDKMQKDKRLTPRTGPAPTEPEATFTSGKSRWVKDERESMSFLIEAVTEVKTADGYIVRLFCIGFTKRRLNQKKSNCYAKSSQVRQIRKKMADIMVDEAARGDLKNLFKQFNSESIAKRIEKECQKIFPLQNVYIRKAKVVKKPKFDAIKLQELHSKTGNEDTGVKVAPIVPQNAPQPGGHHQTAAQQQQQVIVGTEGGEDE